MHNKVKNRANFKARRRKQYEVCLKPINFQATPLAKFLRAIHAWTRLLCKCFRKENEPEIKIIEYEDSVDQYISISDQCEDKLLGHQKEDLTEILRKITTEFFVERNLLNEQASNVKNHQSGPLSKVRSESSLPNKKNPFVTQSETNLLSTKKNRKCTQSQFDVCVDRKPRPNCPSVREFLTTSFFTLANPPTFDTYPIHVHFKTNDKSLADSCNKSSQYSETETFASRRKDILLHHNVKTSTRGLQKVNDNSTQFDEFTSQLSKYGNIKQKVAQYFEINPAQTSTNFGQEVSNVKFASNTADKGQGKLLYSYGQVDHIIPQNDKVIHSSKDAMFLFTNDRISFESTDESTSVPSMNKLQTSKVSDKCKIRKHLSHFENSNRTNDCCTSTTETCICSEMYPKFKEWYEYLQQNMHNHKLSVSQLKVEEDDEKDFFTTMDETNDLYEDNDDSDKIRADHHTYSKDKETAYENVVTVGNIDIFDHCQENEAKSLEELRMENRNIMEILNQRYPSFIGMGINSNAQDDSLIIEDNYKQIKQKKLKKESKKMPKIIIKEKSGMKRKITLQVKKDDTETKDSEAASYKNEQSYSSAKTEANASEVNQLYEFLKPRNTNLNSNGEDKHVPRDALNPKPTSNSDASCNIETIIAQLLKDIPITKRKITPNMRKISEQEIKIHNEWSLENMQCKRPSMTSFPTNYELKPLHPDVVKQMSPYLVPTKTIMPMGLTKTKALEEKGQLLKFYNVTEMLQHGSLMVPEKVEKLEDIMKKQDEAETEIIVETNEPVVPASHTFAAKPSRPATKDVLIQSETEKNKFAQVVLHLKNQRTQSSASYLRDLFKKDSKNKMTPKSSASSVSSFIKSLLICVRYSESDTSLCDISMQSDMPNGEQNFTRDPNTKRKASRKLIVNTIEQKSTFSQSDSGTSVKMDDKSTMKKNAKLKSVGVQAVTIRSVKDKNISSPSFTRVKSKKPVFCDATSQTARITGDESQRPHSKSATESGSFCDLNIIKRPSSQQKSSRSSPEQKVMNGSDEFSYDNQEGGSIIDTFEDNLFFTAQPIYRSSGTQKEETSVEARPERRATICQRSIKYFKRRLRCRLCDLLSPLSCIRKSKSRRTASIYATSEDKTATFLMNVQSSVLSSDISLEPTVCSREIIFFESESSSSTVDEGVLKQNIIATSNIDFKITRSKSASDVSFKGSKIMKRVKSSVKQQKANDVKAHMIVEKNDFKLVNVSSGDSHFVYSSLSSETNTFSGDSYSSVSTRTTSKVILHTILNSSDSLLEFNSKRDAPNAEHESSMETLLKLFENMSQDTRMHQSECVDLCEEQTKIANVEQSVSRIDNLRSLTSLVTVISTNEVVNLKAHGTKSANQIKRDNHLVFVLNLFNRNKKIDSKDEDTTTALSRSKSSSLESYALIEEKDAYFSEGSLDTAGSKDPKNLNKRRAESEILLREASRVIRDDNFMEILRFLWLKSGLREHLSQTSNLKLMPIYDSGRIQRDPSIEEPPPVLDKIDVEPIRVKSEVVIIAKPDEKAPPPPPDEVSEVPIVAVIADNVYPPKIKNFTNIFDDKPLNKYDILAQIISSEDSILSADSKPEDEVATSLDKIQVNSVEDIPQLELPEEDEPSLQIEPSDVGEPSIEELVPLKESKPSLKETKPFVEEYWPPVKKESPSIHSLILEKLETEEVEPSDVTSFRIHPHDYGRVELDFGEFTIILKPPSSNESHLEDFKINYTPDKLIITLPWPKDKEFRRCILGELTSKTARKICLKKCCRDLRKWSAAPSKPEPRNTNSIGTMTLEYGITKRGGSLQKITLHNNCTQTDLDDKLNELGKPFTIKKMIEIKPDPDGIKSENVSQNDEDYDTGYPRGNHYLVSEINDIEDASEKYPFTVTTRPDNVNEKEGNLWKIKPDADEIKLGNLSQNDEDYETGYSQGNDYLVPGLNDIEDSSEKYPFAVPTRPDDVNEEEVNLWKDVDVDVTKKLIIVSKGDVCLDISTISEDINQNKIALILEDGYKMSDQNVPERNDKTYKMSSRDDVLPKDDETIGEDKYNHISTNNVLPLNEAFKVLPKEEQYESKYSNVNDISEGFPQAEIYPPKVISNKSHENIYECEPDPTTMNEYNIETDLKDDSDDVHSTQDGGITTDLILTEEDEDKYESDYSRKANDYLFSEETEDEVIKAKLEQPFPQTTDDFENFMNLEEEINTVIYDNDRKDDGEVIKSTSIDNRSIEKVNPLATDSLISDQIVSGNKKPPPTETGSKICKVKYAGIEHYVLDKLIERHKKASLLTNIDKEGAEKPTLPMSKDIVVDSDDNIITQHNKEIQTADLCYCNEDENDTDSETKHYRHRLFNGVRRRCFKSQYRTIIPFGTCSYHRGTTKQNHSCKCLKKTSSKAQIEETMFNFYISARSAWENYETKDIENIIVSTSGEAKYTICNNNNDNLSFYNESLDGKHEKSEDCEERGCYILVPISHSKQNVCFVDSNRKFKMLFSVVDINSTELMSSSSSDVDVLPKDSFGSVIDVPYQSNFYKSKDIVMSSSSSIQFASKFFDFNSTSCTSLSSTTTTSTSKNVSESTSSVPTTTTTISNTTQCSEAQSIAEVLYELCPTVLYNYYRRQLQ